MEGPPICEMCGPSVACGQTKGRCSFPPIWASKLVRFVVATSHTATPATGLQWVYSGSPVTSASFMIGQCRTWRGGRAKDLVLSPWSPLTVHQVQRSIGAFCQLNECIVSCIVRHMYVCSSTEIIFLQWWGFNQCVFRYEETSTSAWDEVSPPLMGG